MYAHPGFRGLWHPWPFDRANAPGSMTTPTKPHLHIAGGTDYEPRRAAPVRAPAPVREPLKQPPNSPPNYLVLATPELDVVREAVLDARMRDGCPVRELFDSLRSCYNGGARFQRYTDILMKLRGMGIHGYLPDATTPHVYAEVREPRKLLKALGLSGKVKQSQLAGLVLFDEYRAWMSDVECPAP